MKIKFFKSAGKKEELKYIQSALLSNDSKKIMELYDNYREPFIAFFISRFSVERNEAIDLYKESFSDFCENIIVGKLSELTCALQTYLIKIGLNKTLNQSRNQDKYEKSVDLLELKILSKDVEYNEQQEIVYRLVLELGEPCNEVLTLFFYEEKSLKEIAVIMNYKNEDVVKTRKSRCIKTLTENILKDYNKEDFEL